MRHQVVQNFVDEIARPDNEDVGIGWRFGCNHFDEGECNFRE